MPSSRANYAESLKSDCPEEMDNPESGPAAAGATANRVAMESVLWARSEGVDLFAEGASVIARAAKKCEPLRSALGLWKHVEFNYESTDTLDFLNDETGTAV